MNKSGIEWIQNPDGSKGLTCNPIVGCEEVSPGCKNCWAKELVATRMSKNAVDNFALLDLRKKGNDLSLLPVDLRIRENLPMPTGAT